MCAISNFYTFIQTYMVKIQYDKFSSKNVTILFDSHRSTG